MMLGIQTVQQSTKSTHQFPRGVHSRSPRMDKERTDQEDLCTLPSTSQASSTSFPPFGVDGGRPSEAASADGSTLEHQESADGQPQERIHSHRHASSSPRCTFGWLLHLHELLEGKGLRSSPQSLKVSRSSLRHIVGKGGRMLHRIEDYTGSFISVTDCDEQQGTVRVWVDKALWLVW